MRGRKPKTTEEKKITGNPGKRRLNAVRPDAPEGLLRCPVFFTPEEAEIWAHTLKSAPLGVIKPADSELLAAFVQQVAIHRQAILELRSSASLFRGKLHFMTIEEGSTKNPLITVIDSCAKNIRALGSELGLTPASRERLHATTEPGKPVDAWSSFGSGPHAKPIN